MISISTPTFNPEGNVYLHRAGEGTKLPDSSRRVSRIKTLDGGCYVYDAGFSAADSNITIVADSPSGDDVNKLKDICELNETVIVSTRVGCFLGVPSSVSWSSEKTLTMTVLITEKLSA